MRVPTEKNILVQVWKIFPTISPINTLTHTISWHSVADILSGKRNERRKHMKE
jgi:hypothetical protein